MIWYPAAVAQSIDRDSCLCWIHSVWFWQLNHLIMYILILMTATKHESIGFFEKFFEKWVFKKMTFIIQYNVFIKFSQLQRIPSEDKKNESKTLQTTKRWSKKVTKWLVVKNYLAWCFSTFKRFFDFGLFNVQNMHNKSDQVTFSAKISAKSEADLNWTNV